MKLIDERQQIRTVAVRWQDQYRTDRSLAGGRSSDDVGRALAALAPETATAADVAAIIGNDSWTAIPVCSECGERARVVVQVGEEPDYESRTAWLCARCVRVAALLFGGAQ